MSTGVPLASVKGEIFEALLWFLPDWAQIAVLALVVLAVVASWVVKIKRRIAHRRAARSGGPAQAAVPHGQGRGADHLGPYAPQPRQGSGADHLGAYAPQAQPQARIQAQPQQPSGADFLGAYAPQQRQGQGPV
ncbi:hypothetical protein ACIF8T_08520 [Streptomyces sp. NPDC085946]|uniref:hypothetical protein n=1 Tax=Streptomyces sp. NPDC085946 TaxID=3365744 RepID=UPI0037D8AF22